MIKANKSDRSMTSTLTVSLCKKEFTRCTGVPSLPRDVTPLRYPGGKGVLKYFLANSVLNNNLKGGVIVEPFCGGSGATIPLLKSGIIEELWMNDASPLISSFWESLFFNTNELVKLIKETPVCMKTWNACKEVVDSPYKHDTLKLGFSSFFLNRTNRSGLLMGGPIGGKNQSGPYLMQCRFNKEKLISRVLSVASLRDKVKIDNIDGVDFLKKTESMVDSSLVFIDPPYVKQGYNIYRKYSFKKHDHVRLSEYIQRSKWKWIITYDDHQLVKDLYSGDAVQSMRIDYFSKKEKSNNEIIFAAQSCILPNCC